MDWMVQEIKTGFQKLICLGLDRQPASELLAGTVMAWVEALEHNRVWVEDLDRPRFAPAFRVIAANFNQWPTPQQFVECLPSREAQKQLPAKVNDPAKSAAQIIELRKLLYGKDE